MSDFIAITFDNTYGADELLLRLDQMERAYLLELDDAVVAVKNENGKVKLRQTMDLTAGRGAAAGSVWGLLVGSLFFMPLVGAAVGAGTGAVSGALTDLGINNRFMKGVAEDLKNGSSALFVVVRKATADKVLEDLHGTGGTVYQTSLPHDAEEWLRQALAQQEATAPEAAPVTAPERETASV